MEIVLIYVGKSNSKWNIQAIEEYTKRLTHYIKFSSLMISDIKNSRTMSREQIIKEEGKLILNQISPSDMVVLLDEKGDNMTSKEFSIWLQKIYLSSYKRLVFIIGGPFGFSEEVYRICKAKISLSKMTFTHDMARLFFIEQLYRAMTIIRGEQYHHD